MIEKWPASGEGALTKRLEQEKPGSMLKRSKQMVGGIAAAIEAEGRFEHGDKVSDPFKILKEQPGKELFFETVKVGRDGKPYKTFYAVTEHGDGRYLFQVSQEVPAVQHRGGTFGKTMQTERLAVSKNLMSYEVRQNDLDDAGQTGEELSSDKATILEKDTELEPGKAELIRVGLDSFKKYEDELLEELAAEKKAA